MFSNVFISHLLFHVLRSWESVRANLDLLFLCVLKLVTKPPAWQNMWNRNSGCELPERNFKSSTNQNKGSEETIVGFCTLHRLLKLHQLRAYPQMQNELDLSHCALWTWTPRCTGSFALWGTCPTPANLILNPPVRQGSTSIFMSLSGVAFLFHHRGPHAASVHVAGLETYHWTYL